MSVINPVAEELVLLGYIFDSLEGRWPAAWIVALSVALRMSYHTYQGAAGLIFVFIFGVIFGVYYLKTRRLGAVIVAHGLWDFVGLLHFLG